MGMNSNLDQVQGAINEKTYVFVDYTEGVCGGSFLKEEESILLKYNRAHSQTRDVAGAEVAAHDAVRDKPATSKAVETASKEWYAGGTLTGAKMSEWNRASYANRLATSADFIARMLGGDMGNLSMDGDIKPMAARLETEISAAYQEGVTETLPVPDIATGCILILKAHGVRGFAR
jgi:hypothetical protein